ncbi:MAG: hypothetical protein KJN64_12320 [Ignavibacteria bacterium]|nr:hypothetical protein [Ignavibacteria bacterium]MBT8383946.1 hypothetical protein [Ignavibacteria bacterium]MBT8392723.1 hypothetical protein [Ignavibacteria bacterium]NNJ52273.1 hypothetical protein [Ignavibacteriaceae bacterium]NNL21713.1 hypothetical protein [Ignavibacteriaceae bacterium]
MQNKIETELADKIINVAYGDASIADKIIVMLKAAKNENVNNLLEEYRATASKIRKLNELQLPDYLVENVHNNIKGKSNAENILSKISTSFIATFSRKAIPLAASGVIALAVISLLIINEPAPTHKYTEAQIEVAENQLKQSLAIVGKVFIKAEKNFSQDILDKQLNKTLNKGYYLVNNILTGG